MRDKDILKLMEEIAILNQFLYMEENNYVEFKNGDFIRVLKINENLDYVASIKNFSLIPLKVNSDMNIRVLGDIVEQLKEQKPLMKNTNFKSRWEEIKNVTMGNLANNFFKIWKINKKIKSRLISTFFIFDFILKTW